MNEPIYLDCHASTPVDRACWKPFGSPGYFYLHAHQKGLDYPFPH